MDKKCEEVQALFMKLTEKNKDVFIDILKRLEQYQNENIKK